MQPRRRAASREEGGQSTLELALLLPVVVVLLLAVLQVGLVARDVVLVTHAAREAARAAAVDADPGAARRAAVLSSGLDPARVRLRVDSPAGAPRRARVTLVYRSATSVPLVGALLGDRTVRSVATMRIEHAE